MELLLVRHALPVRREVDDGPADPELSPTGHAQAERLANYLADERLDAIYSSPLRRARETALPVAARHGLEVAIHDDVAEFDRLSPEYIPVEELKAVNDPRWQAMVDGSFLMDEDVVAFAKRAIGAIEQIIGAHRGRRVAVVCHGGVINTYLAHVLGLGDSAQQFFYPNYTSIHRVAASSEGHRSVVTINETSHLRGTGLPMGILQGG